MSAGDPLASVGMFRPNGSVPDVIRSTTTDSGSSPGSTRCVCTAANAVSSPVTPIGATSNGCSFSSRECGAWSVAMQSIVPLRSASISAWRSLSVRSGGFILKLASSERTASSVRQRWCGVTSQVTFTHAALAASIASTDSRADRCWMWMRALS